MKVLRCALLGMGWIAAGTVLPVSAADPPAELQEMSEREKKVKAVVNRVMPCVVAVTSSDEDKPGSGSGVLISRDGLILTAAHVTQATGNNLTIIFPDGRRVKGTSLGANRTTDAGMARITEPGDWPFVEMGDSDHIRLGDWVVAMGHPGGYSYERRPPVRLGRIWRRDLDGAMFTSCPLIGGDSGGPLFDLGGKVVGIHSSIHGSVEMNRHVAIDTLRFDWEKLMKDQTWGRVTFNSSSESRPVTGALLDRESLDGVLIKEVFAGLPASSAGLKPGDVIRKFDGESVGTFHGLQRLLGRRKPGDSVAVAVQREDQIVEVQMELGSRPKPRSRNGQDGGEYSNDPEEYAPRYPKIPEARGPVAWLGAAIVETEAGVGIGAVVPGSPAANAGLQEEDVVRKVNETLVQNPTEVAEALGPCKPGDKVCLLLLRANEPLTLEITLGTKPVP